MDRTETGNPAQQEDASQPVAVDEAQDFIGPNETPERSDHGTSDSQAQTPQPPAEEASQDPQLAELHNAAQSYGFSEEFLQGLPADKITRLMQEYDETLLQSSPPAQQGMADQQQYQQPLPQTPESLPQQSPTPEADELAQLINKWEDDNEVDPIVGQSLKQLHAKLSQTEQFIQQFQQQQQVAAAQQVLSEVNQAIDSIDPTVYGTATKQTPQQQFLREKLLARAAELEGAYMRRGIAVPSYGELVVRASRGFQSQLGDQSEIARSRNQQITGQPTRSSANGLTSPEEVVRSYLNQAASPEEADGFLD